MCGFPPGARWVSADKPPPPGWGHYWQQRRALFRAPTRGEDRILFCEYRDNGKLSPLHSAVFRAGGVPAVMCCDGGYSRRGAVPGRYAHAGSTRFGSPSIEFGLCRAHLPGRGEILMRRAGVRGNKSPVRGCDARGGHGSLHSREHRYGSVSYTHLPPPPSRRRPRSSPRQPSRARWTILWA